jgi:hypothetical protein
MTPYCFAATIITAVVPACSCHATPLSACRSADYALSSWNLQNPPQILPRYRPMATIHPPTLRVRADNPSAHGPALN